MILSNFKNYYIRDITINQYVVSLERVTIQISMIERIDKIEEFFSKNSFTQVDLDQLKLSLKSQYPGKEEYRKILSIINLKLLHYEIDGPIIPYKSPNKSPKKNKINSLVAPINQKKRGKSKKGKVSKSNGKKNLKGSSKKNKNSRLDITPDKIYKVFENKPFQQLAFALEVPTHQLVGKKNKLLGKENKVSKDFLDRHMTFILGRINNIKKSFSGKKVKKPLAAKRKKQKNNKGSFDTAHKGFKIIYTKM